MAEISFYHLTSSPLESALPRLMEKVYQSGKRALLLAKDEQNAEDFNRILWTYHPNRFLPHGTRKDGNPGLQPIFINNGETIENPNDAEILVITGDLQVPDFSAFPRVLYIFDGNDKTSLEKARSLWKEKKSGTETLSYFKQDEKGKWDKVEI